MNLSSTKKALIAIAALGAVGGGAAGIVVYRRAAAEKAERTEREAAGLAWANLWQCALGGPTTTEEVPLQMRRIALGDPPPSWPKGCSQHATALYDSVRDAAYAADLAQALRDRFGCDAACVVDHPERQFVGLTAPPELPAMTATVAGPPMIADRFLPKSAFSSLGGGADARVVARDVAPDGTARLLLASPSRGHSLCTVRPDEGAVACDALEAPVGSLRLVAGGDTPVLLGRARAGDPEKSYDADGKEIATHAGRHDGFALHANEKGWTIARVKEGAAEQKALELGDDAGAPFLAAGHVAWIEGDEPTFHARPLRDEGVVGEAIEVGALPTTGAVRLCAAGETTVTLVTHRAEPRALVFHSGGRWHPPVALPSVEGDEAEKRTSSSAREPDAAKTPDATKADAAKAPDAKADPLDAKTGPPDAKTGPPDAAKGAAVRDAVGFGMVGLLRGGADAPAAPWGGDAAPQGARARQIFGEPRAPEPKDAAAPLASTRLHLPRQSFTCGEGRATLTWREGTDDIHALRCTPSGCDHASVRLGIAPRSWWHAAAIGDATLVLWRGDQGELRMRFAALEKLATAPDVIVMDAAEYGGPETVDLEAFVTARGAVFWFRDLGFHALAFDAEGTFRPAG